MCLVIGLVPICTGCPTEVPYEQGQDGAGTVADAEEAPPFDASAEDDPAVGSPEVEEPPAPVDRYADTAPAAADDQTPARMPWESDSPAEPASPDAERLFGGATQPPAEETVAAGEPASEPADAESDAFGDFLSQAYDGLVEEKQSDENAGEDEAAAAPSEEVATPSPADDDPLPFAAEPEPAADAPPAKEESLPFDPEDFWSNDDPPAETTPPSEEQATPTAAAKQPSTTKPADSDLLSELWGDDEAAGVDEPADEPSQPETAGDPGVLPEPSELDLPADDTPTATETPTEPEVNEAEKLFEDLPPPKETTRPKPVYRPTRPRRLQPMVAAAIKPLPAVPVLPYNTRHLAWLLGGKLGLAELADLEGATPGEVAGWSDEVDRLAQELRIENPSSDAKPNQPAERVRRMMQAAARAGDALANEHGADHAALLEISLKTNALLVVASDRPDLAAPVAAAVRAAADRAELPRFLWEETVQVLERRPTAERTLNAVIRLHERVESFLR